MSCSTETGNFAKFKRYFFRVQRALYILGGATYCAVASLYLLNRLDSVLSEKQMERLSRWCVTQQQSGFQGRTNKSPNTSYSFWIGATLKVSFF